MNRSSIGSSTGGGGSGGGVGGDRLHHHHHHTELLCRIRYQNNLPDIPFEPKSLAYPFDAHRYVQYKSTSLEKNYKWDILNEQDLGVRIDLINQDYNRNDPDAKLDPKDEKLLEEENISQADLKRAEQHSKLVSWMRRNEYISSENTRFQPKQYDAAEAKVGYSTKKKLKEADFYKDRDSQIEAIERSFEASRVPIEKHYSKPGVYAVQEYQILPDFEMWKHPCAQVIFDDDPAPKDHAPSVQHREMSQALIKGLVDKDGEEFVAYFLPTEETLEKQKRDEENEHEYVDDESYEFKLTREYTWVIKSKRNDGYEENYYFIMRDDGVYYNELETRVRLNKRRSKGGKVNNTKLSVRYRPFSRLELKAQRQRAKYLEPINENDEDDDDDEEGDDENAEEKQLNSGDEQQERESQASQEEAKEKEPVDDEVEEDAAMNAEKEDDNERE